MAATRRHSFRRTASLRARNSFRGSAEALGKATLRRGTMAREGNKADVPEWTHGFEAVLLSKFGEASARKGEIHVTCEARLAGTTRVPVIRVSIAPSEPGEVLPCFALDKSGTVVFASQSAEALLRYSPGTMVSRAVSLAQIVPGPAAHVHSAMVKSALTGAPRAAAAAPCASGRVMSLVTCRRDIVPARIRWGYQKDGTEVRRRDGIRNRPQKGGQFWSDGVGNHGSLEWMPPLGLRCARSLLSLADVLVHTV